jgi:protein tyrosine phosphatase (PTP) superfamily phosphohydrolase (DUF442 family)
MSTISTSKTGELLIAMRRYLDEFPATPSAHCKSGTRAWAAAVFPLRLTWKQ